MLQASRRNQAELPSVFTTDCPESWNSPQPYDVIKAVMRSKFPDQPYIDALPPSSLNSENSFAQSDALTVGAIKLGPPPINNPMNRALQVPRTRRSYTLPNTAIDSYGSLKSLTTSLAETQLRKDKRDEQPIRLSAEGIINTTKFSERLKSTSGIDIPVSLEINDFDLGVLKQLLSTNYGSAFVAALSTGDRVFAAVTATNGNRSKRGKTPSTISRNINFSGSNQGLPKVKSKNVFSIYPSSAIAIRLLQERQFDLLGSFLVHQPERIIGDILNIPISGCLFSSDALVSILKHLVPVSSDNEISASEKAKTADALIKNYFKFSNPYNDKTLLPKQLQPFHSGSKYSDILPLQGSPFIGEVLYLLSKFSSDSMNIESFSSIEKIKHLETRLDDDAWCISAIVGNSFHYLCDFVGRIQQDQNHINRILSTAFSVGEAALGVTGSAAPGAGLGATVATTGIGLFQDLAMEYASQPGTLTETSTLAATLAEMSNGLREKSVRGFYLPGMLECTEAHFEAMERTKVQEFKDFLECRRDAGKIFYSAYAEHLKRYAQGPLEQQVTHKKTD